MKKIWGMKYYYRMDRISKMDVVSCQHFLLIWNVHHKLKDNLGQMPVNDIQLHNY